MTGASGIGSTWSIRSSRRDCSSGLRAFPMVPSGPRKPHTFTEAARSWLAEAEEDGLGDRDYSAVLARILGSS